MSTYFLVYVTIIVTILSIFWNQSGVINLGIKLNLFLASIWGWFQILPMIQKVLG